MPLNRGRFLRAATRQIESWAWFTVNRPHMLETFPKYRIEALDGLEDGWVIPGRYGEVYEYGPHMLGATVVGGRMLPRILALPFVTVTQRGDDEMCIKLPWTPELLSKLAKPLKLRKRRAW